MIVDAVAVGLPVTDWKALPDSLRRAVIEVHNDRYSTKER